MSKELYVIGIVIAVGLLCWSVADNLSDFTITQESKSEFEDLRFQKVETFVFQKTNYETHTAVIYEDTKTGVKYLYIWKGAANGGPCITRLWEE